MSHSKMVAIVTGGGFGIGCGVADVDLDRARHTADLVFKQWHA
jgi:hypothetical protein